MVGRGGQAIVAFFSWKAFSAYVRSAMETTPITYGTFFTIFLEGDASFRSTIRIIRDFVARKGLRSKVAMMCIVLNMIYMLAFPTLAGAMTGYTPASGAFVTDTEQNMIPFSSFVNVAYVIHDGPRVNLTKDYPVPYFRLTPSKMMPKCCPTRGPINRE